MSQTLIKDNEFASLWFHPEKRIVHHQLKKFVSGNNLRDVLNAGYEQLKANGGTKWLSDDRNNGPLSVDDEKWAQTDWFPKVAKAGWKFWAVVLPTKVVGKMNINRFVEMYLKLGINAKVFSDPDEALKWLESA